MATKTSFINLPAEIRVKIYKLVFQMAEVNIHKKDCSEERTDNKKSGCMSLLTTSKLIAYEARPVFLEHCHFFTPVCICWYWNDEVQAVLFLVRYITIKDDMQSGPNVRWNGGSSLARIVLETLYNQPDSTFKLQSITTESLIHVSSAHRGWVQKILDWLRRFVRYFSLGICLCAYEQEVFIEKVDGVLRTTFDSPEYLDEAEFECINEALKKIGLPEPNVIDD